jgi:hypothetical protein
LLIQLKVQQMLRVKLRKRKKIKVKIFELVD